MSNLNLKWIKHDGSAKCPVALETRIYGWRYVGGERYVAQNGSWAAKSFKECGGWNDILEYAIAADEPDADSWIATHGKRPELPDGTLIQVKVARGFLPYRMQALPVEFWDAVDWEINTHYRLHDPQRGKSNAVPAEEHARSEADDAGRAVRNANPADLQSPDAESSSGSHREQDIGAVSSVPGAGTAPESEAQWLPIESAPKDGSTILVLCGRWASTAHWHRHQQCWATCGPSYERFPADEQPEFWQKIQYPAAPTEEQK